MLHKKAGTRSASHESGACKTQWRLSDAPTAMLVTVKRAQTWLLVPGQVGGVDCRSCDESIRTPSTMSIRTASDRNTLNGCTYAAYIAKLVLYAFIHLACSFRETAWLEEGRTRQRQGSSTVHKKVLQGKRSSGETWQLQMISAVRTPLTTIKINPHHCFGLTVGARRKKRRRKEQQLPKKQPWLRRSLRPVHVSVWRISSRTTCRTGNKRNLSCKLRMTPYVHYDCNVHVSHF